MSLGINGSVSVMLAATLLVGVSFRCVSAEMQTDLPRPPCGTAMPFPAYPAYPASAAPGTAAAVVRAWQAEKGSPHWVPPACTGWAAEGVHGFGTLVALAGRFELAQGSGTDQILGRFGAISMLRGARYWSVSDGAWRPLVSDASALDGLDPDRRRSDFNAAELGSGRDAYFVGKGGLPDACPRERSGSCDLANRERHPNHAFGRHAVSAWCFADRAVPAPAFPNQLGLLQPIARDGGRVEFSGWRPRSVLCEPRCGALPPRRRRANRSRTTARPLTIWARRPEISRNSLREKKQLRKIPVVFQGRWLSYAGIWVTP